MPFRKIPLPELIEQGRKDQNGLGWIDFLRLAKLSKRDRPSYRSAGIFFNREQRTMKAWFTRYDKENK